MTKVLIIFGGNSSEHDVSCISAKGIVNNINSKLFKVTLCGISKNNIWYIYNDDFKNLDEKWENKNIQKIDNIIEFLKQYDIIFPIIHGNNGEDGKLQGLLDLFNIKYIGSKTLASAMGMDKEMSKMLFEHLKIKQVPYMVLNEEYDLKQIEKQICYPMIVKPANGGSSIGIKKANNKKELKRAINEASKYDKKIIIEKFIKSRELEIAIIEDKNKLITSDIGEIISSNEFYDYKAKYKSNSKLIIPADINKEIKEKIQDYAIKIFKNMNAKNYARIDFFLNNNDIYINEINTIPGFTKDSMYPKLIMDLGISYQDLITKLIKNAI